MDMIIVGTSHFVSRKAAVKYYSDYEPTITAAINEVNRKLAAGEIHIGKPSLQRGQSLRLIDNGTRYAVIEPFNE
jgi:hypothetical protein